MILPGLRLERLSTNMTEEMEIQEGAPRGLKALGYLFLILLLAGIGGQAWLYCRDSLAAWHKRHIADYIAEDIGSRELTIDPKAAKKAGSKASAEDLNKALFVALAKAERCDFALSFLANATKDAEVMAK